MNQTFDPEGLFAALEGARVRYVAVGGMAVGVHGVVRATRDLDLVPDPAADNMDRLAALLVELGAEHPIDGQLTGAALGRPVSFKLATHLGDVQVLNRMPAIPPFAVLDVERKVVALDSGVTVVVCSLRHLRAMKLASGRPRDLVDVAELDELHGS